LSKLLIKFDQMGYHFHMLYVQRRHAPPCSKKMWDKYMRCSCPLAIRGTLSGRQISLSTAKFLPPDQARNPQAARDLSLLWEKEGRPVRPENLAGGAAPAGTDEKLPVTVGQAVDAYLTDARDRNNGESSLYKKEGIFRRRFRTNPKDKTGEKIPARAVSLLAFCDSKGIRFVPELTLAVLREWRGTWKVNSLVRSKRQGSLLGFVWFCERSEWLPQNYALNITRGLGKIEVKATPTGYFMPDQYRRLIDATYAYSDRPSVDKHNRITVGGDRPRALTELMRWTGLRIRDAVTLERMRLQYDDHTGKWRVILYQRKTGEPVYCPVPPHVAELLNSIPASQKGNTNARYFFWTGNGNPKTVVSNWQRTYQKLFALAGLSAEMRCHPHMFRDTFAVEAILSGMPIDAVSKILGHSSIKVTEKHYLPWVRARQESLDTAVTRSWEAQGIAVKSAKVVKMKPRAAS
jgi:integrase